MTIDGAGSYGIQINASGSATFAHVTVQSAQTPAAISPSFEITKGDGNQGF